MTAERLSARMSLGRRELALMAVLTAVYVGSGLLGRALGPVDPTATLLWAPSGVAVAFLLRFGPRLWPGVALGAVLVALGIGAPLGATAALALGGTAEAYGAARLLGRLRRGHPAGGGELDRIRRALEFAGLAAVALAAVGATVAMAVLLAAGALPAAAAARTFVSWWAGDALGILVVAPPLLVWGSRLPPPPRSVGRPEAVLLGALLLATAALAFRAPTWLPQGQGPSGAAFLLYPLLVWAALRFDLRGATTATAVLAFVLVLGDGAGPNPMAVQLFAAVFATTGLVLGAAVCEWREAQRLAQGRQTELERVRTDLEERFRSRTAELARGEAQLADAQAIAALGTWDWDLDDRIALSAEMGRLIGEDAPGGGTALPYDTFLGYIHPDDRAAFDAGLRRAIADVSPFSLEHRIVRPGGLLRVLRTRAHVITDPSGRAVRVTGTGLDVTEEREAEAARVRLAGERAARLAAEEAVQARDEFLSIAAHELRTPLTALTLQVDAIKRGLDREDRDEERLQRRVNVVHGSALRLTGLIERLLDLTRINSGRLRLERESLDLAALVDEVAERLRDEANRVGSELRQTRTGETRGMWDRVRIEQVLTNLLSNALKFGRGQPIDVAVTAREAGVELIVRDRGIGIPPEHLPRLFKRFERASTARSYGGLGLGLYITRALVEAHGGTITVNSETDVGTAFTVTLPRTASSASEGPRWPH